MSLVATRLQNWRVENPEFDRNMARPLEYGALDFFIEQTNAANSIINPNLRDRAFESIGNTVQIPVINYDGDVTVSNVRSCVIADDENTSALYTVNWVTLAVGFTMVPQLYRNNEISYEHDFARKMEKICRALATAMDVQAIAALEANKSQVFKDSLYYTITANSVQIPWIARMEFLSDMNAMMRANAYPGLLHVIGGAGFDSLVRKMAEHDIYNDVNKRMEYDNKVFHYTNNITNESGIFATGYIVEDGNVGKPLQGPVRTSTNGTLSAFLSLTFRSVRTIIPQLVTNPELPGPHPLTWFAMSKNTSDSPLISHSLSLTIATPPTLRTPFSKLKLRLPETPILLPPLLRS